MATLTEARRLARRVWGRGVYVDTRESELTKRIVAFADPGDSDAFGVDCHAPTRRAALTGLCAALEAMLEGKCRST